MTHRLRKLGVKPAFGELNNGLDVYGVGPSTYEEITSLFSVPSIANPAGNTTRIELQYPASEVYTVEDMYIQWDAVNSDAVNAPTFLNIFSTLSSVKVFVNRVEKTYLKDTAQIQTAVNNYLRQYSESEIYQRLGKFRNENAKTLNGETFATSSTTKVSLPLFVLCPNIDKFVVNKGIHNLAIELIFLINYGTAAANGQWVKSNTTSNAYGSNLTYQNITLRTVLSRHSDPLMYRNYLPISYPETRYETKIFNVNWGTVNTDKFVIDLSNTYAQHKKCQYIHIFGQDPAAITAYNDADCGLFYSGATYFCPRILLNSREIVNHQNSVNNLGDRRRYNTITNYKRNGVELPMEVLNASTNLGKIYIFETCIDLSNVELDEKSCSVPISGVSNESRSLEIEVYCGAAIGGGSNVNIYCILEYVELCEINEKSGDVTFKK